MKAEHRKELQTNALADRMGRVIQRMKTRPSKNSVLTVVLVVILVLAVVLFFFTRQSRRTNESRLWTQFAGGHLERLLELSQPPYSLTNQGKGARFEVAWFQLWELGIKAIPAQASVALQRVKKAQQEYRELAEECKDDPVLGPEALYNIAVAEEAHAIKDQEKHLKAALAAYREVVERYPNSAHAKSAKQRADELSTPESYRRIREFYEELSRQPMILRALLNERLQRELKE
jgi:hypothetical protein